MNTPPIVSPQEWEAAREQLFGRAYLAEFGRFRDGRSQLPYSVYHDRYQRTPDGWKFTERVYEIKYIDTTPLAGSAPHVAPGPMGNRDRLGPEDQLPPSLPGATKHDNHNQAR